MGVWTRRFVIEYGRAVRVVGVHFRPWGMAPFVTMPLKELRDRWAPAAVVWQQSFTRLREMLADGVSTEAMLRLIDGELRSRIGTTPSDGLALVGHTARGLETSWGSASIAALVDRAGVSSNHLAAQYTSHVGVTPKRLARIYRFARLILSIDPTRPIGWAEFAAAVGYFDQPHLINEFKDFTGHTPTAYLALRRRFPAERNFPPDMGPMPAA